MHSSPFFFPGILVVACLALTPVVGAQVPGTLQHAIPAPPVGVQAGGWLGFCVSVEGGLAVAGAPLDDTGAQDSGAVKVFDSATGSLLHVLINPSPAKGEQFGRTISISGTRMVVGTPYPPFPGTDPTNRGGGSVYVYDLGSRTPTVPAATLDNPDPFPSDSFGSAVAISGTRVVVGASNDDAGATNAGSAYVYDLAGLTPTVPILTLNNPDPTADDLFASSVAISGTRVVVGAYNDDVGATNAGSAYIYDLGSPTPTLAVLTLNNPDPRGEDLFGYSVAIAETRVVIGVLKNDTGADSAGAVYIYDLSGATPTVPLIMLKNPDPEAGDFFGSAVGISGARVVVGAQYDDTGGADTGSAYVYDLGGASPSVPVAALRYPGHPAPGFFGRAAAISGTRVVVGAFVDDTGASHTGSAYLYELSGVTPGVPVAKLHSPGPSGGDLFGDSVGVSGTRVVVGAYTDGTGDPAAIDSGSAYVYDLESGAPTVPVVTLNNPTAAVGDMFGDAVAISGPRVVVGAAKHDLGLLDVGIAYVYDLASATPSVPVLTLNNPSPTYQDSFGNAVALSGTLVVVGASMDRTGPIDAGRAYVYDLTSGTPTVPVFTLDNPSPALGDRFGSSVAIDGTRVVVAAYNGLRSAGDAYVYDLSSSTPTAPVATLSHPGSAGNHHFGNAVAISGTRVIVGAWKDDIGANDAGSAYVYDLASSTPMRPVATLNNPAPGVRDYFGSSVAIAGTRVVVGAYADDTRATDAGSGYLYDLSSATPTVPVATLNNPGAGSAAGDLFGSAVAIDGTIVAVGTPSDDTVMTNKGYAYIYRPNPRDLDGDGLLDAWELTYWPATTGHGPVDDFDHDGYVELLELAFGLNPTLPDAGGLPSVADEDSYLTMTITKHAGVTYEVQSAGTLLAGEPDSFSAATTKVVIDDPTMLKVRDTVLIGTSPARFLRATVTAAP